jgi:hypothetical protein
LCSFDVPPAQGYWAERAADEIVTAAGEIAGPPGGRAARDTGAATEDPA